MIRYGLFLGVAMLVVGLGSSLLVAGSGPGNHRIEVKATPTPSSQYYSGAVKSVDAKGNSVTITVGVGDKAKEVTVKVTEKTTINVNGKAGSKLEDLKEGMTANVRADNANNAISIMAKTR